MGCAFDSHSWLQNRAGPQKMQPLMAAKRGAMMNGEDSPSDISAGQAIRAAPQEAQKTGAALKLSFSHFFVDVEPVINSFQEPMIMWSPLKIVMKGSKVIQELPDCWEVSLSKCFLELLTANLRNMALLANLTAANVRNTAAADTRVFLVAGAPGAYVPIPLNSIMAGWVRVHLLPPLLRSHVKHLPCLHTSLAISTNLNLQLPPLHLLPCSTVRRRHR